MNLMLVLVHLLHFSLAVLLLGTILAGCSKNPVTGEREFAPYST